MAGACMSLGLRFAGTADKTAAATLREMTLRFVRLKSRAGAGGDRSSLGAFIDRPTLETCVGVAAVALSCVMAGTGDLSTLRLLRRLRLRLDASAGPPGAGGQGAAATAAQDATSGSGGVSGLSYGAHMAISTATGFLFLGGGARSFATDNGSVAALLIATYPRFPQNTGDQRCHLQAFRHLYALATRSRLLQTVDAATQRPVYAPVELVVKKTVKNAPANESGRENVDPNVDAMDEDTPARAGTCPSKGGSDDDETTTETVHATAPCLLPEEDRLVRVKVVGDRYWPVEVDLTALETRAASLELLYGRRQLPVQRLTGALPYAADPTGARAGLARALHAAAAASLRPPKLWFNCDENNDDATGVAVRASTYGSSALQQDAVGVFTSDPALLGFKRLMCGHVGAADAAAAELAEFCRAALHECMSREEPSALPAYVDMHASVAALLSRAGSSNASNATCDAAIGHSLTACDVRLLAAYSVGSDSSTDSSATISRSLAAGFHATVAKALEDLGYAAPGG